MPTDQTVELRRFERVPVKWSVRLVLSPEKFETDKAAVVSDVSQAGMGVRTTLMVAPGDWVGIVLGGDSPHAIPSRVVWVREEQHEESTSWKAAGLNFLNTVNA